MRRIIIVCIAVLPALLAFTGNNKNKPKLPDEFVLIPAGNYYNTDIARKIEVPGGKGLHLKMDSAALEPAGGFYISRFEVTNLQYRQFYNQVSPGMTATEKAVIACDSLGWRQELRYNEPLKDYYYRHPAYDNYPVVNISYEGALQYCRWLQQKIEKDNPRYTIEVKLPQKSQWIYAAQGGRREAMFPWGNFYLRNRKGEYLCNFKIVGDQAITRNPATGKPEVHEQDGVATGGLTYENYFTTAVKSFFPNDYDLYNMCGNAAEMIADKGVAMGGSWNDYGGDVHIKSQSVYDGPVPTVGFRPVIIIKEKE